MSVSERKRSGRRRTATAVTADTMANGTSTSHARRRRTSSTSSGLYFLPGSIGSPCTLEQRAPELDLRLHALSTHVGRKPPRKRHSPRKRIAVKRVIDGERQIPRQAEIDANRCPIAVEAVISAGQPHVAYGKGRICMKLSTPVDEATHRQARRVRKDRLRECFEKSDVPVVSECGVPGPPDLAVQACIANHTIVGAVVLDDD